MERIFLVIQDLYFSEKSIKNINITAMAILIAILSLVRNKITLTVLYNVVSSDLFTLSGILAGFLFTGLSMVYTSSNRKIEELKITDNFKLINDYFMWSIVDYILVIFIYLLKTLFIQNIETFLVGSINYYIMMAILLIGIYLFFTATILFVIALFILGKIISS